MDESGNIIETWSELVDDLESLLPRIKGIFVIAHDKLNESFAIPRNMTIWCDRNRSLETIE